MKLYNVMTNVGSTKYLVNFHNGIKKYQDGSRFFDIKTFKNKTDMKKFINELGKLGYKKQ